MPDGHVNQMLNVKPWIVHTNVHVYVCQTCMCQVFDQYHPDIAKNSPRTLADKRWVGPVKLLCTHVWYQQNQAKICPQSGRSPKDFFVVSDRHGFVNHAHDIMISDCVVGQLLDFSVSPDPIPPRPAQLTTATLHGDGETQLEYKSMV